MLKKLLINIKALLRPPRADFGEARPAYVLSELRRGKEEIT